MKSPEKLPRQFPHAIKVGNAIVKIYRAKANGYDLFTVVHYRDGKRERKNFGRFADARMHAQEVATQIARGRVGVLTLTTADRDSYATTLSLLKPLGLPLHAAIEEYVAARAHLHGDSLLSAVKEHAARRRGVTEKRVTAIVAELIEAKESDGLSRRYIETLRSHLNRFAGGFQTGIGSVTARLINEWLKAQNVGPRARNNIRMSIVTLFHFARAQGYLPKGTPTEAEDVAKAKERDGAIGIFTPKQMATIMENAAPDHALFFALGGFAGLRRAEIERLAWNEINFERGHIEVGADKAKTATRRLVPIQPNLMQWLAPWRGSRGRLFSSRRLADYAIAAVKATGQEWPDNALRHSYATYRLALIADAPRVALEMGNSVGKLMTNYRELADERDGTAWFRIVRARASNVVSISTEAA
ncbi:MAG: tyrosine-type recombinase/integrase [Chthoniobacterales bacterium]|nr:tyrosine-type recombinase/integrase [Chthoniobacterales bacterium]